MRSRGNCYRTRYHAPEHRLHPLVRLVPQPEPRRLDGIVGPHVSVGKRPMVPGAQRPLVIGGSDSGHRVGPDQFAGDVFVVACLGDRRIVLTWMAMGKKLRTAARSVIALGTSQYVSCAFDVAIEYIPVPASYASLPT